MFKNAYKIHKNFTEKHNKNKKVLDIQLELDIDEVYNNTYKQEIKAIENLIKNIDFMILFVYQKSVFVYFGVVGYRPKVQKFLMLIAC